MKEENEIRSMRDTLLEYCKDPKGYRLTPLLLSNQEIDSQIMALNWVLEESRYHPPGV